MELQEVAEHVFDGVNACEEHRIDVKYEDVVRVLAGEGHYDDWDTDGWVLVELQDGRYARVEEWSDSTGHGCRCSGNASFFDDEETARRLGMTAEERGETQ